MTSNYRRALLLLLPLFAFTLMGLSCEKKITQEASEDAAERAIEQATNNDADVELGTNSITINTNEGSFQAGDDVEVPADFPSDLYVYSGDVKAATTTAENSGFSVSVETDDSVSAVKQKYEDQLESDGWTISVNATYGDSVTIAAQKGDRTASITAATGSENKTTVIIVTASAASATNSY